MKYYIAYGSNLSVTQMAHRCPDAVPVGTAAIEGWQLVFRHYATIERSQYASVPVVVWRITDRDERRLDRYEGFPRYYVKQMFPVRVTALRTQETFDVEAMVYIMTPGRSPVIPPSMAYYDVIEDGYRHFDLDLCALRSALDDAIYRVFGSDE